MEKKKWKKKKKNNIDKSIRIGEKLFWDRKFGFEK